MFTINTEKRNIFGKKLAKARKEGKIPAVVYGKGKPAVHVFINSGEFKKIRKQVEESTIVKLKGESKEDVLIYDVAKNILKNEPTHVDFYALDMNKTIIAEVPIAFEGISSAVKEFGATLVKVIHDLEIEALPKDFPREIKVDLSSLAKIGDKVMVKDLNIPKSTKVLAKPEQIVVLAKAHEEEKIEETPVSVADIEISEKRGKKEEESAETAVSTTKPNTEAKKGETKK